MSKVNVIYIIYYIYIYIQLKSVCGCKLFFFLCVCWLCVCVCVFVFPPRASLSFCNPSLSQNKQGNKKTPNIWLNLNIFLNIVRFTVWCVCVLAIVSFFCKSFEMPPPLVSLVVYCCFVWLCCDPCGAQHVACVRTVEHSIVWPRQFIRELLCN